jgi:hypothetical protein
MGLSDSLSIRETGHVILRPKAEESPGYLARPYRFFKPVRSFTPEY